LDGLAGRDLAVVAAELLRELADRAQLGRREDPARDLDAHHEEADLRLVVVQPVPHEAHDVLFPDRLVAPLDQLPQVFHDVDRLLLGVEALDRIAAQDELQARWLGHGLLLTRDSAAGARPIAESARPARGRAGPSWDDPARGRP